MPLCWAPIGYELRSTGQILCIRLEEAFNNAYFTPLETASLPCLPISRVITLSGSDLNNGNFQSLTVFIENCIIEL
jgi:hypothetical protein